MSAASPDSARNAYDNDFVRALELVLTRMREAGSYHTDIFMDAMATEIDRGATYGYKDTIKWDEREICYIYGAIYKLLRIKNNVTSVDKALDDIKDAYNYTGLLYNHIMKNRVAGKVEFAGKVKTAMDRLEELLGKDGVADAEKTARIAAVLAARGSSDLAKPI